MKIILKNLFLTLTRYKTASILNILGITVAFTAFMIVTMYVKFEHGYNQTLPDKGRIFRLEYFREGMEWEPNFSRPVAELFLSSSPHIEAGTVWSPSYGIRIYVKVGDRTNESGFTEYVNRITPGFIDVFRFDMIEGTAASVAEPDKVLIPESMAYKFFGKQSAYGQKISFADFNQSGGKYQSFSGTSYNADMTVGGVYKDFPENSMLPNEIYANLSDADMMNDWRSGWIYVFVKLDSPANIEQVYRSFLDNYPTNEFNYNIQEIRLTPVGELYFSELLINDPVPRGNRRVTNALFLVAVLIIVIASINYINFSVALTSVRIHSINTQKVLGCSVSVLRRNLIIESAATLMLAFILALFSVWAIEHSGVLAGLIGSAISSELTVALIVLYGLLALSVGIVAGIYPALHMTSFPPSVVLSGSYAVTGRVRFVRKTLVGFQYVISIVLIVCAFFIHIQNKYVTNIDLGFDKGRLLQVKLSDEMAQHHAERYKQSLLEHPDIVDVGFTMFKFLYDGSKTYKGAWYKGANHYVWQTEVSYNFPAMLGIRVIAGRDLRLGDKETWIFNETAARELEIEVGDSIHAHGMNYIVGIFPDIHFESMYRPIKPMGFLVTDHGLVALSWSYIKIVGNNPTSAINHIRKTLADIDPSYPATIDFFDKTVDDLYQKSRNQGLMVTIFSMVAVLLSIIGVFGLVIFEAQGRIKEIAVRKVMGATVKEILVMFNTGFVKIVLVCFAIAILPAWYVVRLWLENFAYKTPMRPWVFLSALLLVVILTILTVTYQSYRVAVANPADTIKKS